MMHQYAAHDKYYNLNFVKPWSDETQKYRCQIKVFVQNSMVNFGSKILKNVHLCVGGTVMSQTEYAISGNN